MAGHLKLVSIQELLEIEASLRKVIDQQEILDLYSEVVERLWLLKMTFLRLEEGQDIRYFLDSRVQQGIRFPNWKRA